MLVGDRVPGGARTPDREQLDLAGLWRFRTDPEGQGVAAGWTSLGLPPDAGTAPVPGIWNTVVPGYAGAAFYETSFDVPSGWRDRVVRVLVGAANYLTEAWLNGRPLGRHEGGYTPFAFHCGTALREKNNRLVLRIVDPPAEGEVDGLRLTEVPSAKESWYGTYGGPWGGVWLEASAPLRVEDVFLRSTADLSGAHLRVELASARAEPAVVRLRVSLLDPGGEPVGSATTGCQVTSASTVVELSAAIRSPVQWSPENPTLYTWEVAAETLDGEQDRAVGTFGLRSCELRDGRFFLNGRERFIKGVLLQPWYPRTLVYPPDPEMPARDVELIRSAGFNLVRCHLRPPPPGFLELCDRTGLMAYVETPLAWIEPGPRLLEHGRRELAAMVRRDRNHPSVVLWGLFNENAVAARAVGAELLAELPRLDPTRPAIDNSGGSAIGEVGQWAWSGTSRCWSPGMDEPAPFNDVHVYLASPLRRDARQMLETSGMRRALDVTPDRPAAECQSTELAPGAILVSEYGCGGLPDFDVALDGFGDRHDLTDADLIRSFSASLAEGLRVRGLDREIGGTDEVVRTTQSLQATGLVRQTTALRVSPHVSGYILTQLAEAGWEQMAAIVGLWREPRPGYAAMAEANRPRRLHVRADRWTAAVGSWILAEVWLLDEHGPVIGPQTAMLSVDLVGKGRGGLEGPPVSIVRREVALGQFGPYVDVVEIAAPVEPGLYRVRFAIELADGRQERATHTLLVVPRARRPWRAWYTVVEKSPSSGRLGEAPGVAVRQIVSRRPPYRPRRGLWMIDVVDADERILLEARDLARDGGHVCLVGIDSVTAPRLAGFLGLPIVARGARGNFMGTFHYLRHHPVFEGLPVPCIADEPFAEVLPAWALDELPGAEVIAGCFSMPDGGPGFDWRATIQTLPYGSGRLTFYQFRPGSVLDPLGPQLLASLVRWLETMTPDGMG